MTVSQFSEVFMLGPKQTYVWLERMCKAEVAEKKSYRVQVGMYVRQVPHYKLGKKAKAIIDQIKSGR